MVFELHTRNDDERPVYLSGNFNAWALEDIRFRLLKVSFGSYRLELPAEIALPEVLEYKYTKGDWGNEELDEWGKPVPNRKVRKAEAIVMDFVPHWERAGINYNRDYLPEIVLISEDFEIPQLNKRRRIWALLPYDYHRTTRRYPVIYLQDGQNLFDPGAPYGNWAIDRSMAILAEQGMHEAIVIAVEHGGIERINEFNPFPSRRIGKAEGKEYITFITQTLKPYVDGHFRTLPQRNFTGIGGSSMGGLVSIYAGFMFHDTFGRLMIFSPSLWVSSHIYFNAIHFTPPQDTRIYVYAGGKESRDMVPSVENLRLTLERKGLDPAPLHFHVSIDPEGRHNEARWGEEFPKAMQWLFFTNMMPL